MRHTTLAAVALAAAFLLAVPPAGAAEDDDEPPLAPPEAGAPKSGKRGPDLAALGLTGSLRTGYWSSNRLLDDDRHIGTASAWLKLDRRFDGGFGVFAEGYAANEDLFGDRRDASRLREVYLDGRRGDWDFRLGKQIVAWGRADRLNPTDNLTPRDFTLLAPEVDEDRFGSLAAKAAWTMKAGLSLTGLWLPQFRPHVFPFVPRGGVQYAEDVPASARQWALKLDQSGGEVDWSLSYFDGFDLSPDLSPGGGSLIRLSHHRTRVIGADAATTRGAWRYAVEAAYTRTEDTDGTNPFVKNPFWYGVLGVERDFTGDLSVIVQLFARHVEKYANPEDLSPAAGRALAVQQAVLNVQYERSQQGLTARIAKKWLNETVEGELAATALLGDTGYALRPKLVYVESDHLKLIAGFEAFRGSDKTSFGRLERNRTVFTELRYFF